MAGYMDSKTETKRTLLIGLLLACATLAVFWPVVHNDFINYDDPEYIALNQHVTGGITWAFPSKGGHCFMCLDSSKTSISIT